MYMYSHYEEWTVIKQTLVARIMGLTWGPSEADRTQVGPMLAQWTLLSEDLIVGILILMKWLLDIEW